MLVLVAITVAVVGVYGEDVRIIAMRIVEVDAQLNVPIHVIIHVRIRALTLLVRPQAEIYFHFKYDMFMRGK